MTSAQAVRSLGCGSKVLIVDERTNVRIFAEGRAQRARQLGQTVVLPSRRAPSCDFRVAKAPHYVRRGT